LGKVNNFTKWDESPNMEKKEGVKKEGEKKREKKECVY
jgi:hypothetical protein